MAFISPEDYGGGSAETPKEKALAELSAKSDELLVELGRKEAITSADADIPASDFVNPPNPPSEDAGTLQKEMSEQTRIIRRYLKTRNNLRDCGRILGKLAGRMEVAAGKVIDKTIILDLRAEFEKVKIRVGGRIKICRDMY